ncbi:MAG: DUF4932 domain-containing protein [Candidatus Cloacimonetes bacterium]|nr:DUF4932 domain-containing protein [Candidatus Cloacimonadota bacterium]
MTTVMLALVIAYLLCLLPISLCALCSETSAPNRIKPVSTRQGLLNITIDPRLELLAVLQHLCGSKMTSFDSEGYAESINAWFADFKSHPVLSRLQSLEEHGFSYDLPVSCFLRFDGVPLGEQTRSWSGYAKEMDEARMEEAAQGGSLEEFYAAVNDFVQISDFGGWFESQRPYLEKTVSVAASLLATKDDMICLLIDWYGYSHDDYTFIISLLVDGGYGPSLVDRQNKSTLYCVTSFDASENPADTILNLTDMIFHEFSHPYVNPLVDKYFDMIKDRSELFEPIKNKMDRQAYPNWWITVVEHFVRASEARLVQLLFSREIRGSSIQWHINEGFIYLDTIYNAVLEYEQARRETGIRYDEYFPRLMQRFAAVKELSPEKLRDLIGFKGPINTARMYPVTLIYPDPKRVEGVNEFIIPTVNILIERLHATAYTDTQALELDLNEQNICAFGAWGSNLWLNKHLPKAPFQILADKIIADKEYPGTNLRLAVCLPNPLNSELGLAIYTAQSITAMKGGIRHGPQDWYVYETDPEPKILGQGDFSCKRGEWIFDGRDEGGGSLTSGQPKPIWRVGRSPF